LILVLLIVVVYVVKVSVVEKWWEGWTLRQFLFGGERDRRKACCLCELTAVYFPV